MSRNGLLFLLLLLLAWPVGAQPGEADLTRGWDDTSLPLRSGRVRWSASPAAGGRLEFSVVFQVEGAAPNRQFTAGLHFFEPGEVSQFGGRRMGGPQPLSREGRNAVIAGGYDFGVLATDSQGNGRAEFRYTVPNQAYAAQFTVRRGANCPAQSGDCACVYRTGGRFGDVLARFGPARSEAGTESGLTRSEAGTESELTRGWDDTSLPLRSGRVRWSASPAAGGRLEFSVVFQVEGAAPNRQFTAGVHFFEPGEVSQFGGRRMGGRQPLSREGRNAVIAGGYDFGVLATDSQGNGRAEFRYTVPNQAYAAQFTVRRGANCPAQSGDCACVYRTGGQFGARLERFGSGAGSVQPPPTAPVVTVPVPADVPRSIGPAHWCLACGLTPERRFSIGFTVPAGVRTVVIQIRNGLDESGDLGVMVSVFAPGARRMFTTRATQNGWEEFRVPVTVAGDYWLSLQDDDTSATGTAPGNGGSLRIVLQ